MSPDVASIVAREPTAANAEGVPPAGRRDASVDVETLHRVRIELAREALVEANDSKQRTDLEQQLTRELEDMLEAERTAAQGAKHRASPVSR